MESGRLLKLLILLLGLLLGDPNAENWGDYQKKKFFMYSSLETLIPFKEEYQGLLKQHVPFGGSFSIWKKWGYLQKFF